MMPFRLLQYLIEIMRREKKRRKDGKLPLIIPMVLYDGNKPWNHSTDIRDLIAAPKEIVERIWNSPFKLIQAADISEDEIKQHQWAGAMAWVMAHAHTRDVIERLKASITSSVLEEFDAKGGRERQFVIELLRHLLYTSEVNETKLQHYTQQHFTHQVEREIMTLAQRLEERGIHKGIQQGEQKGEQKGRHEIACELLQRGFDIKEVAAITKLPLHEVELLDTE